MEHDLVGQPGDIHCRRCGARDVDELAWDCEPDSDTPQDTTPPELKQVLADALAKAKQ